MWILFIYSYGRSLKKASAVSGSTSKAIPTAYPKYALGLFLDSDTFSLKSCVSLIEMWELREL